ncbi:MAG: Fic family protein [Thermoleophilia bacterium]
MSLDPHHPYNELPPLPPQAEIESTKVLRKAITAGRALAELKGLGGTIPNQEILINSIILQEAKASSEIENVVTTNDELFKAFSAKSEAFDPATKEVLRYREALWYGFNELEKRGILTTNSFVRIFQTIKQTRDGIRKTPGTALVNGAGRIIYTPPEGEVVMRGMLKNLEDYIHGKDKTDPLIKLAMTHYQFESIHPFADGNGRTGRIINILFLVQQGLLDIPVLYLSSYIIQHKTNYHRLLRAVTEKGQWEPWIMYMLDAVEQTAVQTRGKIIQIRQLIEQTLDVAHKKLPPNVYSKELIELLFRQPYTKGQYLVDSGLAKRQTAAEYLKALEKIGILKSHRSGREMLYLNVKLLELLSN